MPMNERLAFLKQQMRAGEHKSLRQAHPIDLLQECEAENLSWPRRVSRLVRRQCEAEQVVIGLQERIHILVKAPQANVVIAAQPDDCLAQAQRLQCLPEGARRVSRDDFQDGCHVLAPERPGLVGIAAG